MANIFLISDTHFGHANILNFLQPNGERCRPFATVEEMNECMVTRWNAAVRPQDHVYHLGDVAIKRKDLALLAGLNGHLRLVRGNHDIYSTKDYLQYFDEIYGVRVLDDLILSHIPIHPDSVRHWCNVHGHLHNNAPQGHLGPKYYNVSVEMIDYTPVPLETVRARIRQAKEDYENSLPPAQN